MSTEKDRPAGYMFGIVPSESITVKQLGTATVPWKDMPRRDRKLKTKCERLPESNEQAWDNVDWCENCPYPDCMFKTLTECKQARARGDKPCEDEIKEAARQNVYYSESKG